MITSLGDPRLDLARIVVGAVTIRPEPHLPAHLLHLVDAHGTGYYAKQHHQPGRFAQEVHAYTRWTHHLAATTPTLLAHHEGSRTLLLTEAPGIAVTALPPGHPDELRIHHTAGAALRALHAATLTPAAPELGQRLAQRLTGWAERAHHAGLTSPAGQAFLLATAADLAGTELDGAVCHLDYQPRNWNWSPQAGLALVDFEHMRPDARLRDLARLHHRLWPTAPNLRDAFHQGYGPPTTAETAVLHTFGAYEAATALVRGHETGNTELHHYGETLLDQLM